MTKISVPGVPDPLLEEEAVGTGSFLEASTEHGIRVDATRGAPADRSVIEDAAPDDVVELRMEGGLRRWVPVADLSEALALPAERGGDDTLVLPASLHSPDATRGVEDWAISGLRLLRAKLGGSLAGKAGSTVGMKLATDLEKKLVPEERLGRIEKADLELSGAPKASDFGSDPWLLFIHGTASRTGSAFAGLSDAQQGRSWDALVQAYDGRVVAYDHQTLTRSPVGNALGLVGALGKGSRLHVVSHSRGGIVGELLCRGSRRDRRDAFTSEELTLLRRAFGEREGAEEEVEALKELTSLLDRKRIVVERFVPVGSPLRGTDLAGGKLDRWASVLLNLLDRLAGLSGNPAVKVASEFTTAFLLGMVKARADWTLLPGLAAQMPGSPLVRLLNIPSVQVDGQLSAIAGDVEPDGLLRRLATWTSDLFYGEDNDFVVQTSSMTGGADRGEEGRHFTSGPRVSKTIHHCNYFATPETVRALEGALLGSPEEAGFRPIRTRGAELTEADLRARNSTEPRPVVFVLPGIMGSHLSVDGNRVWLDVLDLMFGGMRSLAIDAEDVTPERLVGRTYDDVTRYLQTSHDVRRFPYDWRRSLVEEADRLAADVTETLASTTEPVRFLAHSMGGLLARTMIARHPEVWRDVCARPGGRLVMLGTPNQGSFTIPRVLLGVDRTLKMLALLDMPTKRAGVLEVVSRFPGLLELLPRSTAEQDLFGMQAWAELVDAVGPGDPDWPVPRQEDLARAGHTRKVLDAVPVDPDHMCYVAGWAPETPSRVAVGEKGIEFFATPRGDGQVTWASGIPAELRDTRTWYMNVAHGDLAAHEPAFPALHDLLVQGRTERLSRTPPATWSRDGKDEVPLREETVTTFPSEEELTRAVMAMGAEEPRPPEAALRVSVCHGDVGYANHHVFVGHYVEDTIVSAERALDIWLDGELSVRHLSGLYPGPVGTTAVVFNRPGRPLKGGAVVGLGGVGTLSAGGLEKTMTVGILKLAAILRDRARERGEAPPPTFGISPVLLGTGEGGISLNAALRAMLDAAAEANAMLSRAPWEGQIHLGEIQFMELYLDRAIEAADTLARMSADTPGTLLLDSEVSARRGGRTRPYAGEGDRWSWRLQIQGDPEPGRDVRDSGEAAGGGELEDATTSLRFTVPTIRAAAGSSRLPADRRLVDGLLDEATTSTRADPELSETLFELLIPNEVKDHAPEKRDLLLLVDEGAARYPWELLKDPSVAGDPVAVESQMIRQLVTDRARRQINAASGSRVLVVGDPVNTHLPQLVGAAAEAEDVVKLFGETSYDVREIIHGTHSEIVRALFSSRRDRDLGYRIIHIAAHGEHQAEGSGQSGVVIGDRLYLTPHTFNQLRSVPELVFLNCCHLGRMDEGTGPWRPNRIAANLGTQLIRIGVKAVVVAGWAVNDSAARTFSREFYGRMLRGETFGNAVLKARAKTWRTHSESNTWGAYQCYGDPQFTLPGEGVKSAGWRPVFRHPSVAVTELQNLMSRARTLRLHSTEGLNDDVDRILEAIPPGWRDRSDVTEALGLALGELGRLEEALAELQRAVRTDRPQASVASQEKWANYRARLAARTWLETDRDLDDSREREARRRERLDEVKAAIARLDGMMTAFGPTTERLNLMGSAHKRRAMIVVAQERTAALTEAQEWYRRASRHAQEESGKEDYLGLVNALALYGARKSRGRRSDKDRAMFQREYAAAKALVAEMGAELHPFFGTSAPSELELIRSITAGTLDQELDAICAGYEAAFRRTGSVRELASIVDQLTFFIEMLRVDTDEAAGLRVYRRATRERLVPALNALRERVHGLRTSK